MNTTRPITTHLVAHCDHGNYARGLAEIPATGSWANGYPSIIQR